MVDGCRDDEGMYDEGWRKGRKQEQQECEWTRESDSTFLLYAIMTKNLPKKKCSCSSISFFLTSPQHGQIPAATPSLSYRWRWLTVGVCNQRKITAEAAGQCW